MHINCMYVMVGSAYNTHLFITAHLFEFWLGGTLAISRVRWCRAFFLPNSSRAALKKNFSYSNPSKLISYLHYSTKVMKKERQVAKIPQSFFHYMGGRRKQKLNMHILWQYGEKQPAALRNWNWNHRYSEFFKEHFKLYPLPTGTPFLATFTIKCWFANAWSCQPRRTITEHRRFTGLRRGVITQATAQQCHPRRVGVMHAWWHHWTKLLHTL